MVMVISKNALPEAGAMYVTISFKVFEIKNKSFVSNGNSAFVMNVRNNRKLLLNKAIYNAIKIEFNARSVTAYDVIVLDYHYTYYLNNYEIKNEKNKYYETYTDFKTKKRKKYLANKYELKEAYVVDYSPDTSSYE